MKYLKNRLLLYITITLVFTVTVLTGVSSVLYYRNSTAQAEQDSSYLAAAYEEGIRSVLTMYRSKIEIIAAKSYLTDGITSAREQQALLADEAKAVGFNYIAVADARGNNPRGDAIADQTFFQEAQKGNTYISSPKQNDAKKLTLWIATPVSGTDQILYGEFSYDGLSKALDRIKIGESGYAFVINRDGRTVIHPETANVANPTDYLKLSQQDPSYLPIANIYRQMTAGKTGTGYSVYKGVRRLVAYTPLSGPEGWSVAVTTPVTQLDENLRRTLALCAGIGLLVLLSCLFSSRIFAGKVAEPIVQATRRIEQLAQGNLHDEVGSVKGRDEGARLMVALGGTIHSLRTYITDISRVLGAVAEKDLTVTSTVNYEGDFVPIQDALERIVLSLNQTLKQIVRATDQVRSGSEQVALGGQNLAENSTEQAATTELLTNSLELVAHHTKDNAEYSVSMRDMTQTALQETQRGNQAMRQMLGSMESIDASSKKIKDIIHVINDIAYQTNILALNAAVEASHAGEAGKGFSVVADEVRQLASKSAEAAKNTAELIENTIQSVAQGLQDTEKTSGAFQKILEQTDSIHELVGKMSETLNRQSQSIAELSDGMRQISAVTQSNSATAQESAATSEELLSQTQGLEEMVAEFHVSDAD